MSSSLCCKPFPGMRPDEILFLLTNKELNGTIAFRSLDLSTDLGLIHNWVNQPYAKKYWQMDGDESALHDTYKAILNNPQAHSFVGVFDEKIVCQIDCYDVSADELKNHVEPLPGHCGIHILMHPPRQSLKGLTEAMLRAFIQFFFSFSAAQTLYGEPDATNTAANIAAKRSGFAFQKTIQLSYKTANLYSISREQFFKSISNEK